MLRIAGTALQCGVIGALLFLSLCDWRGRELPWKSSVQASSPTYDLPAETAYRVRWDFRSVPLTFEPGVVRYATVRVTNTSSSTWPSIRTVRTSPPGAYCIRLSYRWWDADRENVITDYAARVDLPARLPPGKTVALSLEIQPPAQPGHYKLQFDLVQELVCWFEGRGAVRGIVDVHVQP